MNKQEYNNVIGISVQKQSGTNDSLQITREALNNMGVVLPQGDLKQVSDGLATDNYMGWRKCTVKEAQEYANEGTAVVAVSEDKIALVAANEDEGKVAANSSAVMTLDENTPALAVADMAFYANSRSGTTISTKERVTIKHDDYGGYVVFGNNRKTWKIIGYDTIYNDQPIPPEVTERSTDNYKDDFPLGNIKTYSIPELRLLFAIDPYGVANYVKRYAENEYGNGNLARILEHKDWAFQILFGRFPNYFRRNVVTEEWYKTEDRSDLSQVMSESELYFGTHRIKDALAYKRFAMFVLELVFDNPFFSVCTTIAENIKVYNTGVIASIDAEQTIKDIFNEFVVEELVGAFISTYFDWASYLVSSSSSFQEIADLFSQNTNFTHLIIGYCANTPQYEVVIEADYSTYNLNLLYDRIG